MTALPIGAPPSVYCFSMQLQWKSAALACAALLSLSGCYAYLPSRASSIVGRSAQLTLTDSGAVVLAGRVGRAVEQVRGSVVAETPGVIDLAVDQTIDRDGVATAWKHEVVEIPRLLSQQVTVRQFSATRTMLFGGIVTVALVAIERGFHGGGSNALGPNPRGLPPSALRRPHGSGGE